MTPEHKPKILWKEGFELLCAGLQDGCQPKDSLLGQAGAMTSAVLDVH